MKKIIVLFAFLFSAFGSSLVMACTTAIISGKCTVDGRPILFKQRDAGDLENKLVSFSDGKYDYVALVNAKDTLGRAVWGGYNSAGFAIMNSASYNLNKKEEPGQKKGMPSPIDETLGGRDGVIMKLALQKCATIDDFARLLDSLPKPLGTSSNFGVIDAQGNGAYFETGNYKYVKYDVNDPQAAPFGYLIRTNFSYSGDRKEDKGLSRYQTATEVISRGFLNNTLSVDFLFKNVSRSLKHGITQMDLYNNQPKSRNDVHFYAFRDFIPRYLSVAVIAVQGIKPGINVNQTTLWCMVGSPMTTVSIPVWITQNHTLPAIVAANKQGIAKLNDWGLQLKKQLFPITRGEGQDYIDLSKLINEEKSGILQKILPIEDQVKEQGIMTQNKMLASPQNFEKEVKLFYDWVDKFVSKSYHDAFGIDTDF